MKAFPRNRILLPLLAFGALLSVIAACDRQDNDWALYDPALKILTVEADTMRLAEGGEAETFRISLPMVPDDTVRVLIAADNAQIEADPDTVIFVPVDDDWTLPRVVAVSAADDLIDEGPHESTVSVLAVTTDPGYDGQGGEGVVPVAITDNDRAGVHVTETSLTLVESVGGTVGETYRVRLLSQPLAEVTISAAESPSEPSFHFEPASLVFTPENWQTEQEIRIWAELDQVDADNLDLVIQHSAASTDPNYDSALGVPSIDVALLDNTLPPTASLALATRGVTTLLESAGTVSLEVVITLDRPSQIPVTVHLATRDGAAIGADDFQILDQDVVFNPGDPLSQTFSVLALDDNLMEDPEDFQVVISAVSNVLVGEDNRVDLTLIDDDQITLSLSGVDGFEDAGSAAFVVSIPFAVPLPVAFALTTANGSASAGSDYQPIAATFAIPAGQTQRVVPLVVLGDSAHEPDEDLTASLGGLSGNASWDGIVAQVVIFDDDPQTITFADFEVDENATYADFIIELAAPYNEPVELTINTQDGDGQGSISGDEDALGGLDFSTVTNAVWTIPPGVTSHRYQVALTRESAAEATREYFRLNIQSATHPGFAGLTALCAILDEDQPQLAVTDASVLESDANALFTVSIVDQAGNPVTSLADIGFTYTTQNQTAEGELDYTTTGGTVVIPAGLPSVDLSVPILEDAHDDDNETFVLQLTAPVNTTILDDGSAPFCLIADNEFPSINLAQTVAAENEGSVHEFTVFLTTQRQDPTGFMLSLAPGNSDGPGVDYTFGSAGYRIIPPFTSSLTFQVPYLDDQLAGEVDEVLQAQLSNADVALGVIALDMAIVDAPALNIQPDAVTEGSDLVFDVLLTAPSTAAITFSAQYSSGTANVLVDIDNSNTGPFTIPAGVTAMSIATPTIAGDGGDEAVEDFVITLINPVNATLGAFNSATGLITDGDPPLLNLAADAAAVEGSDVIFTVNLSWTSGADVDFFVAFADGTAAGANIDFNDFNTGPYTVPAGALSTTVVVPTLAADGPEFAVEDFSITLQSPTNGLLGGNISATGLIQDGDQPELSIPAGDTVVEGGTLNFVIHLDPPTIVPVFFDLVFGDGSTQGVEDYVPSSTGPFSMMPGTTDTTITVSTIDDAIFENTEQFVVRVGATPSNAVVGLPSQANGVITDND